MRKKIILHFYKYCVVQTGSMALGAGANVRACELEALCLSPVEVATQQTFSILMPISKGPPGGLGCHL